MGVYIFYSFTNANQWMQRILVVIENEKKITVAHLGDILNAQSNFKRFYWIFHTTWFLHSISDITGWE